MKPPLIPQLLRRYARQQDFMDWLQADSIARGLVIVRGVILFNKWIKLEEGIPIVFCLN